ncbi:MAG: diaminopimelate epimerase [bacterium]|nr:diaminopimelate epimerase [bacterium]
MTRRLPFVKMHGAGNDFLMVAAEDLDSGRPLDRERIAFLCDRRRGVGADGLIVIGPAAGADFGMVYYNSDGGEASMCGNGARCAFAFARARGLIDREGTCASASGALRGRCEADGLVSVDLTPPRGLALAVAAAGAHPFGELHRADTGVPHLVVPVDDVDAVDLPRWGAALRHDAAFAPAGTNVNFVAPAGDAWRIRTYERGVESETLACGTGASATALVLWKLGRAASPVALLTRGGDRLTISILPDGDTVRLRLNGPAVTAFRGEVDEDA